VGETIHLKLNTLTHFSQRLSHIRAGGIALFALLLAGAQLMQLPLAYPNLLLIGGEWLLLHSFVLLSQRKWRVSVASLTLQLLADIAIVASILAFSGGVHNPFFALLLLPLLLTVGILPLASQYSLLAFMLVASTLLILVPAPASSSIPNLPNSVYALLFAIDGGMIRDTPFNPIDVLAKLGLWLNLLLMASITAFFLSRLHQRLDEQQQALQAAQTSSREAQHLLTLGLTAASTAHEISTPLATISLLASEAQDAYDHHETTEAKAALTQIQTLIQTCKQQISHSLKQHNLNRSHQLRILLWSDYLSQLLAHWQALRPSASVRLIICEEGETPKTIDLPQLTQAITTLLNNANDATNQSATLTLSWNQEHVMLCVINQGSGFPKTLLASFPRPQLSDKVDGHGMGLMLAHASIARLGGDLVLNNPENGGAQACITLPIDPKHWRVG
jgi:two-component system sensor histidine kinase RegB